MKPLVLRRALVASLVGVIAICAFAPADIQSTMCYNKSTDYCASQSGMTCSWYSWNYTAEKRVTYKCCGNVPVGTNSVFIVYGSPCCSSVTAVPPDPPAICNPTCPYTAGDH